MMTCLPLRRAPLLHQLCGGFDRDNGAGDIVVEERKVRARVERELKRSALLSAEHIRELVQPLDEGLTCAGARVHIGIRPGSVSRPHRSSLLMLKSVDTSTLVVLTAFATVFLGAEAAVDEVADVDPAPTEDPAPADAAGVDVPEEALLPPFGAEPGPSSCPTSFAFSAISSDL